MTVQHRIQSETSLGEPAVDPNPAGAPPDFNCMRCHHVIGPLMMAAIVVEPGSIANPRRA